MGSARVAAGLGLAVAAVIALGALLCSRPVLAAATGPDAGAPPGLAQGDETTGDPLATGQGDAPSANTGNAGLGVRIGLQAGHWRADEAPAPYNAQLGSSGGGKTEAEVNLAIAEAAARVLRAVGYTVDILPTAIPQGYQADLVVAIHADGGPSERRGFFVDHSSRQATVADETRLAKTLTDAYAAVGIPNVYRGTVNSQRYYGYYSVDAHTPMVLIETGFLTNPLDQQVLIGDPERVGAAIAQGIVTFLGS